jgi:hypothetical protein
MGDSRKCLILKLVVFWTLFVNCLIVDSSPTRVCVLSLFLKHFADLLNFVWQSILLNSTESYDTQAAVWTFDFNIGLVSNTSKSPLILRVMLELLDLNNTSSLFAVSSKERFQHIRIIGRNNSDQVV